MNPAPTPAELVRIEARALLELSIRLDGPGRQPCDHAVQLILQTIAAHRRVILLGVGKSGLIARKIAATMRSTGTPAHFLHPSEALHGDLGMITPGDLLIALSASGETEEILALLPTIGRLGNPLVSLCGAPASTLATNSAIFLDCSVSAEACAMNLAPTASTTVMLALGDALALQACTLSGFNETNFASLHPGGRLGHRLARVADLMHSGPALPCVSPETPMTDVIHEMSHKKLGMTTVLEPPSAPVSSAHAPTPRRLLGMISDGDLRRLLERDGPNALAHTAGEIMNPHPLTVSASASASEALTLMEDRKITALIVTSPAGEALGVVHLHDLWSPARS